MFTFPHSFNMGKWPLELSMSQKSPRVTGFKTADEIPYPESNGVEIVAIGQVDL